MVDLWRSKQHGGSGGATDAEHDSTDAMTSDSIELARSWFFYVL